MQSAENIFGVVSFRPEIPARNAQGLLLPKDGQWHIVKWKWREKSTNCKQWPMNQLRVSYYPWYCLCQIYAVYYLKYIHIIYSIYSIYIYGVDTPKESANILIYSNNSCHLKTVCFRFSPKFKHFMVRIHWKTNNSPGKKALSEWMHVNLVILFFLLQIAMVCCH